MQILLTNDDGIHAEGLAALQRAATVWGEITVVAPDQPYSGCGHLVNVARPLVISEVAPRRLALDGAPADCTRIGLTQILPQAAWVIAGVNDGGNLGVDVYMSGTVAAVREAAMLGKPGVAFSQYRRGRGEIDWAGAESMVRRVLIWLEDQPCPAGAYWNVNLPTPQDHDGEPEIVLCPLDTNAHPLDYEQREEGFHYRGNYHERPRNSGSDVDVCFSGRIAVSRINLACDS